MDNTRFITAIEDPKTAVETEFSSESNKQEEKDPAVDEKDKLKSDVEKIDVPAGDTGAGPRKPRAVDQFFANQPKACLLSPIKANPAATTATAALDQTQESLELKLDSTDWANRVYTPQCVQPNDSCDFVANILDENLLGLIESDAKTGRRPSQDYGCIDSLQTRKRLQEEMEPAVFDVPRATKIFHREKSAIPEFCENSAPLLQFTSETDNLFKPEIDDDGTDRRVGSSDTEPLEELGSTEKEQDEDHEVAQRDFLGKAPNGRFNMTLDMTLRTSGGISFASGLFLAIDEALDPFIGAILPYGGRRRGVNVLVAGISILVAIYLFFFMS